MYHKNGNQRYIVPLIFYAYSDEEVVMYLKSWLPHVRVVRPGYIGDLLLGEFRQWIDW
ncbi:MAG TPA: hypothetical protein PLM29_00470 [Deltaproteobacteria bacterium]|nr:hypothetical protein [Deltaproteobacteria bacterium]